MAEFTLMEARNAIETVRDEALDEVLPLAHLEAEVASAERLGIDALVGADRAEDIAAYRTIVADIDEDFLELERTAGLTEERANIVVAVAAWHRANRALDTALAKELDVRSQSDPLVRSFTGPLRENLAELSLAINESRADVASELGAANRHRQLVRLALILIGIASFGIVLLLGRRLTRSIAVPISALQDGTRRFGRGELQHRIVAPRHDELGELADGLNAMAAEIAAQRDELNQNHKRLLQSQKMEAVGQLAGGIAHDFNNLLLVVGTYADFLHDSFEEDDPRRHDAAEIRQASDRAAALTRQLLTFSRRDVTQPVALDAAGTIVRLEDILRRTLTASIELRLELEPGLRATVIDPGQLEQAVLNLVLNARNAMPDGGTLTIRGSAVGESGLDGLAPGDYVALAVADTGHGMSDDVRRRALEPFFTTRAAAGGSGLGLATVYGIVTDAGGSMTIESSPGEGTTVVLYLPTTTESVDALVAEEPTRRREQEDDTVVLLAEDEPTIRELTTRILSAQGYTVLAAGSGTAALELARNTDRIDVLLTDVIMPSMTGSQLAATIGRERPGVRTIYMSGYSDQIVAQHGVLDANTLYLQKPFRPQELLELLEQALAPAPAA